MYSKVKIAGHPIHPMLVAFPVAFYTATLVCYLVYNSNEDPKMETEKESLIKITVRTYLIKT